MVNYTVKYVLKTEKVNDAGRVPIYLRIIVNRETAYMATGHYILPEHWNEKAQTIKDMGTTARSWNTELAHRRNQVIQKIVELQVANKAISAKIIKDSFTAGDLNDIFNFIDEFCREVKHKKDDQTIDNYQKHARKLEEFNGSRKLNFEAIDKTFLKRYEQHLRKRGAGNNYVHAIWKTLKTFFNAAKKRKLIEHYPFDEYENPIYVDPEKDYLNLEELAKLEKFADETNNKVWKQTAVYFLFGCYSGLRISDWKKFDIKTHVDNSEIKLRATKNGEWVCIPFSGPLARNIERMLPLPLDIEEPTLNEKIKIIAEKIGIKKRLSSHCGRKTFAVTMCAERGISCETCARLMGITVTICERNYYRVTAHKIKTEVLKAWSDL